MGGNEPYERRELTDKDRRIEREALEQYRRDMAEATKRPPAEIHSPGKFTEPLGLHEDGSFQPPLTEEEKAHNREVWRMAREETHEAREDEAGE